MVLCRKSTQVDPMLASIYPCRYSSSIKFICLIFSFNRHAPRKKEMPRMQKKIRPSRFDVHLKEEFYNARHKCKKKVCLKQVLNHLLQQKDYFSDVQILHRVQHIEYCVFFDHFKIYSRVLSPSVFRGFLPVSV